MTEAVAHGAAKIFKKMISPILNEVHSAHNINTVMPTHVSYCSSESKQKQSIWQRLRVDPARRIRSHRTTCARTRRRTGDLH